MMWLVRKVIMQRSTECSRIKYIHLHLKSEPSPAVTGIPFSARFESS